MGQDGDPQAKVCGVHAKALGNQVGTCEPNHVADEHNSGIGQREPSVVKLSLFVVAVVGHIPDLVENQIHRRSVQIRKVAEASFLGVIVVLVVMFLGWNKVQRNVHVLDDRSNQCGQAPGLSVGCMMSTSFHDPREEEPPEHQSRVRGDKAKVPKSQELEVLVVMHSLPANTGKCHH